MQTISNSEFNSYGSCRRKHYYSYGLKIQGPSGNISSAVYRGIITHSALAQYFLTLQNPDSPSATYTVSEDEPACVSAMRAWLLNPESITVNGYVNIVTAAEVLYKLLDWHAENWEEVQHWEILHVEEELKWQMIPEVVELLFIPDLIVRLPNGIIRLIDHKTVYDFKSERSIKLDPQLPKYKAGARALGIEVDECYLNQIRFRKNATGSPFQWTPVPTKLKKVQRVVHEQLLIAGEIKRLREVPLSEWEKRAVRSANDLNCNRCPFTQICDADLNGEDTSLMREYHYEKRTRRELETKVEVESD